MDSKEFEAKLEELTSLNSLTLATLLEDIADRLAGDTPSKELRALVKAARNYRRALEGKPPC